jgi:hypothetical protein
MVVTSKACHGFQNIHVSTASEWHVLNFTPSVAFCVLVRGSMVDWMSRPLERASAGMSERNNRAGFERGLKGLNATRTSVRNRVIMMAVVKCVTRQRAVCEGWKELQDTLAPLSLSNVIPTYSDCDDNTSKRR